MTSLPDPVSPLIKTWALVGATLPIRVRSFSIAGFWPIKPDPFLLCRANSTFSILFSRTSCRWLMARLVMSTKRSGSNGFSMKSNAPSRMARTAVAMSPWPVIRMTGISASILRASLRNARPSILGMRMSDTTTPDQPLRRRSRAESASSNTSTRMSASSRVCCAASRTSGSSSTKRTQWAVVCTGFPFDPNGDHGDRFIRHVIRYISCDIGGLSICVSGARLCVAWLLPCPSPSLLPGSEPGW